MKNNIMCMVYVNATIFLESDDVILDKYIKRLQALNFNIIDKDDSTAFLGVMVEIGKKNVIKMTQPEITNTITKRLRLIPDQTSRPDTPTTNEPLQVYQNSPPRKDKWSYRAVIDMLIYLACNTRNDIEYTFHCCTRFQIDP